MQLNMRAVHESLNSKNLACYAMEGSGKECLAGNEALIRNGNSKCGRGSLPVVSRDGSLSTKILAFTTFP